MPNSGKAAVFSLGIIVPLIWLAFKYYPPEIKALRDLYKETKNKEVKEALDKLEKKYYGFKSMLTGNFIYLYGFVFYFLVLLVPEFSEYIKSI